MGEDRDLISVLVAWRIKGSITPSLDFKASRDNKTTQGYVTSQLLESCFCHYHKVTAVIGDNMQKLQHVNTLGKSIKQYKSYPTHTPKKGISKPQKADYCMVWSSNLSAQCYPGEQKEAGKETWRKSSGC